MNKILDVVEDIKQNITDNQYKTIMDSFEINKTSFYIIIIKLINLFIYSNGLT